MDRLRTIEWKDGAVTLVDQTRLPCELAYLRVETIEQMHEAIKLLKVRGAPAIGIAAAFGLCLALRSFPERGSVHDLVTVFEKNADYLASSRPTAVNLFWAIDRMKARVKQLSAQNLGIAQIKEELLKEAQLILQEDKNTCRAIGEAGLTLLEGKKAILTHCNAGGLATAEYGTALAPVYVAKEQGKTIQVYADETRPLLQGSRITAFELNKAGIPITVICDNMAATVMHKGMIDAVIVGADRIASNGDTANKIGTYGVALIAAAHKIPFYVAAPSTTFDLSIADGTEIPIEERGREEIASFFGKETVPQGVDVFNPAFDVTPANLISAIITEKGVIKQPFKDSIKAVLG
ncbi:S-methyl-5-thioribose-1-phosphate isomerase [Chitinispirillales bacterium ANBcel5]|uniref:S-methyl-5-thioribose-1-phosphate isomerase n=1 Tax=Cellulosispirillum alkaliphilum TaxID=3039283 RepID=UPI002A550070|nr:S-methyl-5-thioribose-1-phosphate isomerase [Chitinispirillales bacterium ANBcel5]